MTVFSKLKLKSKFIITLARDHDQFNQSTKQRNSQHSFNPLDINFLSVVVACNVLLIVVLKRVMELQQQTDNLQLTTKTHNKSFIASCWRFAKSTPPITWLILLYTPSGSSICGLSLSIRCLVHWLFVCPFFLAFSWWFQFLNYQLNKPDEKKNNKNLVCYMVDLSKCW